MDGSEAEGWFPGLGRATVKVGAMGWLPGAGPDEMLVVTVGGVGRIPLDEVFGEGLVGCGWLIVTILLLLFVATS